MCADCGYGEKQLSELNGILLYSWSSDFLRHCFPFNSQLKKEIHVRQTHTPVDDSPKNIRYYSATEV